MADLDLDDFLITGLSEADRTDEGPMDGDLEEGERAGAFFAGSFLAGVFLIEALLPGPLLETVDLEVTVLGLDLAVGGFDDVDLTGADLLVVGIGTVDFEGECLAGVAFALVCDARRFLCAVGDILSPSSAFLFDRRVPPTSSRSSE